MDYITSLGLISCLFLAYNTCIDYIVNHFFFLAFFLFSLFSLDLFQVFSCFSRFLEACVDGTSLLFRASDVALEVVLFIWINPFAHFFFFLTAVSGKSAI